jgi:hypothetical protein
LDTWQSDDGAPRVDFKRSDLKANKIVMTGRPPLLTIPEKGVHTPKTEYIDGDSSPSGPKYELVKNSSDDESKEEVSGEEVPNRKQTIQKEGQKRKAKGIVIKERAELEDPKRRRTLEQPKGKGKGKTIVVSESETETEENRPEKKGSKKKVYRLLSILFHHRFVNHSLCGLTISSFQF